MTKLKDAVSQVLAAQKSTEKLLAKILAGHNGSGKSTMWHKSLSGQLQIPLLNADRMMLSILPEPDNSGALIEWAQTLRDTDLGWMQVAQSGVKAFSASAMQANVPFALQTVFSHWVGHDDGSTESKIDLIADLQGGRALSRHSAGQAGSSFSPNVTRDPRGREGLRRNHLHRQQ